MSTGSEPTFFLGEFEHTLDAQRRVAIPAAWRGCWPLACGRRRPCG